MSENMSYKQNPYVLYVELSGQVSFLRQYTLHSLLEGSHRFCKSLHQAVHAGRKVKHNGLEKRRIEKGHISIIMPGYNPMYWATSKQKKVKSPLQLVFCQSAEYLLSAVQNAAKYTADGAADVSCNTRKVQD